MSPAPDSLVTSIAPPALAAPPRRAVRNTAGRYSESERGKLAIDGSLLSRLTYDGHVIAPAWRDPSCSWCFLPQFRRFVLPDLLMRCPDHGKQLVPENNPFPMSEREWGIAEEREWQPIAAKLGIPMRFRDARLTTDEQTLTIKVMREHLADDDNANRALGLSGPTGVGKTRTLIGGLRHEAVGTEGNGLVFYTMPALVRALISQGSDEVLAECIEADLLIVDDIGAAYLKEGGVAEALFEEIVVAREADEAPMWFSTNLTVRAFTDAMGDRIADRLRGDWGIWYSLPGESRRRKARPAAARG